MKEITKLLFPIAVIGVYMVFPPYRYYAIGAFMFYKLFDGKKVK